jgi:Kef-type K+ transport system membrane component KefB
MAASEFSFLFYETRNSAQDGDPSSIGVEDTYHVMKACIFIGCVWLFGKVFSLAHGKLIGEIIAGFILGGPGMLDIVPDTNGWKLIGELGLILIVIQGGTHVDIESFKKIGFVAVAIGVGGTFLSILVSWICFRIMGFSGIAGVAAGVALSSTSIGMANTLLKEHNFLDSVLGRTVAAAAVVDDIIPLILLAMLYGIAEVNDATGTETNVAASILTPIFTSIFILVLGVVISFFIPSIYDALYRYIKTRQRLCPCPCRGDPPTTPSALPQYAPPQAGKKASETEEPVFYHGNDEEEGLRPESRVFMQAKHSFNAFDEGQLSFVEGEIMEVLEFHPSGWWLGEITSERIGRFPRSYCEVLTDANNQEGFSANRRDPEIEMVSIKLNEPQWSQEAGASPKKAEKSEVGHGSELQDEHPLSISRQRKYDMAVLGGLLLYGVLFAALAIAVRSTALLGCFMAGVAFAGVPRTHELWAKHMTPVQRWMISIFFASVGFQIPREQLFTQQLILWGVLFTLPSIITKLSTGFFVLNDFPIDCSVIGWAMVGRGELGFFMAQAAKEKKLLSVDAFVVTVWALVLSTFIAPFFFDIFIRKKRRKDLERLSAGGSVDE